MAAATSYHPCLAQTAIQRQPPEVGAVCEKDACTDLCGGREATCVPTATGSHALARVIKRNPGAVLDQRRSPDCAPQARKCACGPSIRATKCIITPQNFPRVPPDRRTCQPP